MEGKNLFQRISAVMQDIEYLAKDDTVGFGKSSYKAITEEKVTSTVRAAMIRHGIVIIPVVQQSGRTDETVKDREGNDKVNRVSTVDTQYRIQNVDNPEDYVLAASSGTGVDTQDKGIGKAMTYAYKYLLLRTFAIPTGEDPDKVSSADYDEKLRGTAMKGNGAKGAAPLRQAVEFVPPERARELVLFAKQKWGDNAAACFTVYSGYKSTQDVPETEYDAVIKKLAAAPPF